MIRTTADLDAEIARLRDFVLRFYQLADAGKDLNRAHEEWLQVQRDQDAERSRREAT